MKPMLAKKWQDQRNKLTYPCYVQPKLNGVRALFRAGKFQSRDGHLWADSVLAHITHCLQNISERYLLDGELYTHGWSLQQINGAISVNRNEPKAQTFFVEYHVFDIIDLDNPHLSFHERRQLLLDFLYPNLIGSKVKLVPTQMVSTELEAESWYGIWKYGGYEGMMYRHFDAPYGFLRDCSNKENRWHTLLKRKDWIDEEFTIVDVTEGTGQFEGQVGALVFETPLGIRFQAGSGLSHFERREFMDKPPIGYKATVKYEMLSDSGTPLKPTIVIVHK